MANTTDRELIEMYQKRLEMVALENLRLEKEKQELVCQLQQVSRQKTIENKDRHEYEKRIEILSQENQKKQQEAEAQIRERDEKIEALYKEVSFYRRRYWGKSSERYIPQDPNQRKIEFEGLEMTDQETALLEEAVKEITRNKEARVKKNSSQKPVRLKLLPHLKREVITLPDPQEVNPQGWVCIGEKVTEVLAYNPAEIYVKRYVRIASMATLAFNSAGMLLLIIF